MGEVTIKSDTTNTSILGETYINYEITLNCSAKDYTAVNSPELIKVLTENLLKKYYNISFDDLKEHFPENFI